MVGITVGSEVAVEEADAVGDGMGLFVLVGKGVLVADKVIVGNR